MKIDPYGQIILDDADLLNLYYTNPDIKLKNVLVDKLIKFDDDLELENIPNLIEYKLLNISKQQFDEQAQNNWFMPKEYLDMDIAQWVLEQCKNDSELQRAGQELLLYQERNMFTLLKYLKYLVDTMRKNNIVWGVGRGSSVSSFVLYLIGIHRINSLYWDIPIEEFLK
jgi:DNA polymerase III alpha subunit